jgi:spore maturation protein CgeB
VTPSRRRLLIVTPEFRGYWRSIERAFAELGYEVLTHCYDAAPRREKLYNKLRHELPAQVTGSGRHMSDDTVTRRAVLGLSEARPDFLLVVRGDALTEKFWQHAASLRIPTVVWLYDELRRMRHDPHQLAGLARIASYSSGDVRALTELGIPALHVPLAFDPAISIPERGRGGEVTFVGARYPKRERYLRELVAHGVPMRAYGRGWSDHPIDRARTWRLSSFGGPSGRDLPLDEGYAVMKAGLATVNIHGDQDGFTMRTFEASGVGAVQLIDRADVSEFYDPGQEVLVFETEDELVDLCRRLIRNEGDMRRLRDAARRRTLSNHTFLHRARELQKLWA